jgi:hypothetical protein
LWCRRVRRPVRKALIYRIKAYCTELGGMNGAALLNRYRALKPYRGFESLSLRQAVARDFLSGSAVTVCGAFPVSLGATYRTGGQFFLP